MPTVPPGYPTNGGEAFALLTTRERLSIDDLKVLALIELSGEDFYGALANAAPNDESKDLLNRNAQEERGHAHRILKAILLQGGDFALPASNADNPFFRPGATPELSPALLEMIEKSELDGDDHYSKWADNEPHAEVAKILRQNAKEESRHGERVARVKQLLTA